MIGWSATTRHWTWVWLQNLRDPSLWSLLLLSSLLSYIYIALVDGIFSAWYSELVSLSCPSNVGCCRVSASKRYAHKSEMTAFSVTCLGMRIIFWALPWLSRGPIPVLLCDQVLQASCDHILYIGAWFLQVSLHLHLWNFVMQVFVSSNKQLLAHSTVYFVSNLSNILCNHRPKKCNVCTSSLIKCD